MKKERLLAEINAQIRKCVASAGTLGLLNPARTPRFPELAQRTLFEPCRRVSTNVYYAVQCIGTALLSPASLEINMQESQPKPSRRGFFFGAAATGAAVAAVVSLPGMTSAPLVEAGLTEVQPVPEQGGGYSLSEHVKRYYKTTRL